MCAPTACIARNYLPACRIPRYVHTVYLRLPKRPQAATACHAWPRQIATLQDGGRDELPAAVRTCVEAAGHDLSPPRQRALMRAAAYGRPFCLPSFPRQLMYGTACRLRILNAVRDAGVGLPLTMVQLEALSLPVVVARWAAGRGHGAAAGFFVARPKELRPSS